MKPHAGRRESRGEVRAGEPRGGGGGGAGRVGHGGGRRRADRRGGRAPETAAAGPVVAGDAVGVRGQQGPMQ